MATPSLRSRAASVVLTLAWGLACGEAPPEPARAVPAVSPAPTEAPPPDLEAEDDAEAVAASPLARPEPPVLDGNPNADAADLRDATLPDGAPARVAARHILVSFQGAAAASPAVRRTRSAAEERLAEIAARLNAGEDFAALARTHSDGPSASRGGHLGAFGPGVMHAAFEETVFGLQPGERGQVETPFGLHVVERVVLDEVRVAHLLVQWDGTQRSKVERSTDEARARVDEARQRIEAGEPFEAVVRALSDGPSAARGGDLGWFQRGQLLPEVEAAAFALSPGEVSGLVESALGYHLVLRLE